MDTSSPMCLIPLYETSDDQPIKSTVEECFQYCKELNHGVVQVSKVDSGYRCMCRLTGCLEGKQPEEDASCDFQGLFPDCLYDLASCYSSNLL